MCPLLVNQVTDELIAAQTNDKSFFFQSEFHVLIHSAFFVGDVVVAAGLVWPFVMQGQPLNKFKSYEARITFQQSWRSSSNRYYNIISIVIFMSELLTYNLVTICDLI